MRLLHPRSVARVVFAVVAATLAACGGSSSSAPSLPPVTPVQHPTLDADYTSGFVGTWGGRSRLELEGQSEDSVGQQRITPADFNKLTLISLCKLADATAGVDGETQFTLDPILCPVQQERCGQVAIGYYSGTGTLTPGILGPGTLTIVVQGRIAGCGHDASFTLTLSDAMQVSPGPIQERLGAAIQRAALAQLASAAEGR